MSAHDNYVSHDVLARRAEARGDWSEAAMHWYQAYRFSLSQAGFKENYNVCRMIADSKAKGDQYRSLVKEKFQRAGFSEEMPPCPALHRILMEANKEVYGENI